MKMRCIKNNVILKSHFTWTFFMKNNVGQFIRGLTKFCKILNNKRYIQKTAIFFSIYSKNAQQEYLNSHLNLILKMLLDFWEKKIESSSEYISHFLLCEFILAWHHVWSSVENCVATKDNTRIWISKCVVLSFSNGKRPKGIYAQNPLLLYKSKCKGKSIHSTVKLSVDNRKGKLYPNKY